MVAWRRCWSALPHHVLVGNFSRGFSVNRAMLFLLLCWTSVGLFNKLKNERIVE